MKNLICLLLVSAIIATGCAEYRTVQEDTNNPQRYDIEVGDQVLVITNSNDSYEFKVTNVSQTTVSGDSITVNFDDIALLKKEEIDTDETVKTVGSGIGLGLAIALIIVMGIGIASAP
jgi:uncharacterized protein YkuJ